MKIDVYIHVFDTKNNNDIGGVYFGGDGGECEAEFAENIMDEIRSHFEYNPEDARLAVAALHLPTDPETWTPKQTIDFWWEVDCHGENYSRLYEVTVEITWRTIFAAIWRAVA